MLRPALSYPAPFSYHNPDGKDPLNKLYGDILGRCIEDQYARDLFRSVVGQLIRSIEPLTIRSLSTRRQHSSYDKREGVGLLLRLGSQSSNVTSSDNSLPFLPLHTSFRDFLTNEKKSGDFYLSFRDPHDQLADSCLNLLLNPVDGLKSNICELETSYLANDAVEDFNTRIDRHMLFLTPAVSGTIMVNTTVGLSPLLSIHPR
jgi:hypothetical protein